MTSARYDNTDGRLRGRKLQARRLRIWSHCPTCAICKRLTDFPAGFECDHKIPLFKGGPDEDANLQVLCHPCHEKKTCEDLGKRWRPPTGEDGWPT